MKDTKKNKEQLIAELAESEEKYRIQVEMATDAVFLSPRHCLKLLPKKKQPMVNS